MTIPRLEILTKELEGLTREFTRTSLGRKLWGKTDEQIKQLAIPLLQKLLDDKRGYSLLAQINFFDWVKPLNPHINAKTSLNQLKARVKNFTDQLNAATDATQADLFCKKVHASAGSAFEVFYSLGSQLTIDLDYYTEYRDILKEVLKMDKEADAKLAQVKERLAKLQSSSNPRFLRWIQSFENYLWPIDLRKIKRALISSDVDRVANMASPNKKNFYKEKVKQIELGCFAIAENLAANTGKGILSHLTNPVPKIRKVCQDHPVAITVAVGIAAVATAGYLGTSYAAATYHITQAEAFWRAIFLTGEGLWAGLPVLHLKKKLSQAT